LGHLSSVAVTLGVHVLARSEVSHLGLPCVDKQLQVVQSFLRSRCLDSGLLDTADALETCQALANAELLCSKAQAVAALLYPCAPSLVQALVHEEHAWLYTPADRARVLQLFDTGSFSASTNDNCTAVPVSSRLPRPAIRDYTFVHHDIRVDDDASATSSPAACGSATSPTPAAAVATAVPSARFVFPLRRPPPAITGCAHRLHASITADTFIMATALSRSF
jgi:hypothetical protein